MARVTLSISTPKGGKQFEAYIRCMTDADQISEKFADEEIYDARGIPSGGRTPLKDVVWEWFCDQCELAAVDELDPIEPDDDGVG